MKKSIDKRYNAASPPAPSSHDTSDENVLDRVCSQGGQVTFATIRFPPSPTTSNIDDYHGGSLDAHAAMLAGGDGGYEAGQPINNLLDHTTSYCDKDYCDNDLLRYRNGGRIVFARGPWIESHPLIRYHGGHDNNAHHVYKILAFGQGGGGGKDVSVGSSKLECVHGMIFPSSPSPLSSSSLASIIAYGGRRISFLYGGGLSWNKNHMNRLVDNDWRVDGKDDFGCIPINRYCPYLEVSDWVHDIRMLPTSSLDEDKEDAKGGDCFLLAMGMANNSCEIWGFRTILHIATGVYSDIMTLHPSRLQCITCEVRCMTYSLAFYGWDCDNADNVWRTNNDGEDKSGAIPTLISASGTVFGDVVVWSAVDNLSNMQSMARNDQLSLIVREWLLTKEVATNVHIQRVWKTSRIRVSPMKCLKGHLGSVLRVKFSSCGNFLASTSDDRTVRLWGKLPMSTNMTKHIVNEEDTNDSTRHEWTLVWTGWGHSARVLDVAFASFQSSDRFEYGTHPILVTAGEDVTARIWSPLMSEKEVAQPLRGHRCGSIWSVDVCRGIVITGGNDGTVKLYELESRMQSEESNAVKSFVVPQDPRLFRQADTSPNCDADEQYSQTKQSNNGEESKAIKKMKSKPQLNQTICGMEFYGSNGKVQNKLLVATRAGGLFSLDLARSIWTDYSSWSGHVVTSPDTERAISIDPMSGSCVGVHPSGKTAIIGTTEGWLVISSISGSTSSSAQDVSTTPFKRTTCFQAPSYRPIQSISFVDDNSLLVFYARGTVIWFNFDHRPTPVHILTLGTNGIPLSFAYDCRERAMYVGDSRGNVAHFDLNKYNPVIEMEHHLVKVNESRPDSLLTTVHGKEHVTGITILDSTGIIVSVGNDGCIHRLRRNKSTNQLQKLTSIPVPNASGLRHVWNVPDPGGGDRVIIGGFYGNDFVLLDPILGYEFLRVDTGGRQRRQDMFFRFHNNTANIRYPNNFGIAILESLKNGFNSIKFHSSHSFLSTLLAIENESGDARHAPYSSCSIGSPLHADINDICWIGDMLLTGSNGCTVTLSMCDGTSLVSIAELPPHESCVRGVCSSRHQGSSLVLLVTCGGKLSMEFYILDTASSASGMVSFLCSYRASKATIDHRMNSVRAAPIFPLEKQCHLVVAGDSAGNLHICVVSECASPRRTIIGNILHGNDRPVLCLELLRFSGKILVFVGTTGGEITIWVFPGSIDIIANVGELQLDGILPNNPMFSYRAHQTGVNDISAAIIDAHSPYSNIVVCTVGDDQSLSTCALRFQDSSGQHSAPFVPMSHRLLTTECASASALKAVQVVMDSFTFHRIYTTGHDRQLTMWRLDVSLDDVSIEYVSSSSLGTEGSCIDCAWRVQEDGSLNEVVAVGGEGVVVQAFNRNILRAACQLKEANYLLIATGAGFSSDSGLKTYECAPTEYRDMCNPSKLVDDPTRFQQFWIKFTEDYLEAQPHIGYRLLDQWCEGGLLRQLRRSTYGSDGSSSVCSVPWWVYSSNVDGLFRRFNSFSDSLCEIHGSALEFRCACGIGYANGKHRLGKMWDQWNDKSLRSSDPCKNTTLDMKLCRTTSDENNPNTILLCSHCQQPLRPNVLMFHDTDANVLGSIAAHRERYQTWEGLVEDNVAHHGAKLVILEMGCGINFPAVRQESEEVLFDCAKKIASSESNAGSVCLIRINPKDAAIEINGASYDAIPIASTAATTLRKIDCWLNVLTN